MTRKPLGRGLGALLSADRSNEALESQEVDPSLIQPSPVQPRIRFDEGALRELADSIKANGVVQPLLVRRTNRGFELIAGERRLRAAKLAGLQTVPIVVRDIPDERVLEIALVENIQRENLNPIEEAQSYKKLIDSVGLTQEALASRVGRDRTYITNYLRLLKLPEAIQRRLEDGALSAGHGRALLGASDPKRQSEIASKIIREGLSVRQAEGLVQKYEGRRPATGRDRGVTLIDPNVKALEVRLRRELGTQVRVLPKADSNQGILQIEYYTLSDLDRIIARLISKTDAQCTAAPG